MPTIFYVILGTLSVSLISFVGVFALSMKNDRLERFLLPMVALSAGALIAGAFLHLLPEAVKMGGYGIFPTILASFIGFFLIEHVLHWRHCHKGHCDVHSFGYMNLIGDFVHNIIDGMVIAGAFVADIRLGFVTTFAIILHEIPQEIGDFGVLLYAGFSRTRALLLNFATACSAILGGLIGYAFASTSNSAEGLLLPIAIGGFLYIGASDLLPELRKEAEPKRIIPLFLVFLVGVGIMMLASFFE